MNVSDGTADEIRKTVERLLDRELRSPDADRAPALANAVVRIVRRAIADRDEAIVACGDLAGRLWRLPPEYRSLVLGDLPGECPRCGGDRFVYDAEAVMPGSGPQADGRVPCPECGDDREGLDAAPTRLGSGHDDGAEEALYEAMVAGMSARQGLRQAAIEQAGNLAAGGWALVRKGGAA